MPSRMRLNMPAGPQTYTNGDVIGAVFVVSTLHVAIGPSVGWHSVDWLCLKWLRVVIRCRGQCRRTQRIKLPCRDQFIEGNCAISTRRATRLCSTVARYRAPRLSRSLSLAGRKQIARCARRDCDHTTRQLYTVLYNSSMTKLHYSWEMFSRCLSVSQRPLRARTYQLMQPLKKLG